MSLRRPGCALLHGLGLSLPLLTWPAASASSDEVWGEALGETAPWIVGKQAACEGKEVRYGECSQRPCEDCHPVNCEVTTWSDWSDGDCTGLCMRQRGIKRPNNECGKPCAHSIIETKRCLANCEQKVVCPKGTDCVWDGWSEWSACTCSCGGGQKTRDRHIKISPEGDGQKCAEKVKSQMVPCNTHPCGGEECIDGVWGDWGAWGACSASCNGGLKWRVRKIATEATHCGRPAVGDDRQLAYCSSQSCSGDEDCQFGVWSDWGACSCSCDGVKHRSRRIDVYGKGNGAWCEGHTKEVQPCNKVPGPVAGCFPAGEVANCKFASWGEWGRCSVSCGYGQQMRERKVKVSAENGGAACTGALKEVARCDLDPCNTSATASSKPCIWGVWQDWSSCDKCGGQRKRFRLILQMPEDGGVPCKPEASEETGKCPRRCDVTYCSWGDWSVGDCSVSCGYGTVRRIRYLKASSEPPPSIQMYQELAARLPAAAGAGASNGGMLAGLAVGCVLTMLMQWSWRHFDAGRRLWQSSSRGITEEEIPLYRPQARGEGGWMPVDTAGSDCD